VLNLSFLVHDDGGSLRPLIFTAFHVVRFQNLVGRQHFFVHVTKEGKCNSDLFCESGVGGGTVYADSQDDCVACFELGHISLIGLQFFRSTTGERQNVESENDIFLAPEIAQLNLFPFIAQK